MSVRSPASSSPVLAACAQLAALDPEIISFSLAHTDIYWAWAATSNEIAAVFPK